MKHAGWMPSGMLALIVAFPVEFATGQIDYRVNRSNADTAGRALDRNTLIGAGAYNQPATAFDSGLRSNAIITGNVTGLARFHGQSPVLQNNRFRGPLPSAGLSTFQSRSVGLNQVRSNRVPLGTYYLGTQETIADLGYIRRGLTRPGSSTLISPAVRPRRVGDPRLPAPVPAVRDPVDGRVGVDVEPQAFGVTRRALVSDQTSAEPGIVATPFTSASTSSLFGAPPQDRSGLDRWTHTGEPLDSRLSRPLTGETAGAAASPGVPDSLLRLPQLVERRYAGLEEEEGDTAVSGEEPTFGIRQRSVAAPAREDAAPTDVGQDPFADLYRAVLAAQGAGTRRLGFYGRDGIDHGQTDGHEETAGPGLPRGPREDSAQPRPPRGDGPAELAAAAKWANNLLNDPLTSFAGKHRGRLNQFMAQGEALLKAGQYYAAAEHFDLAHAVDSRNPLPLLGRGHALIAAGDYVSALRMLLAGIERFPQIAAFRIDLPHMAEAQPDIFDIRRADLEKQLAIADGAELRFLLGYIELYSGLTEAGLRNLERAASLAPPGSLIAAFPDLVLGRRDLPELSRPRPSSGG